MPTAIRPSLSRFALTTQYPSPDRLDIARDRRALFAEALAVALGAPRSKFRQDAVTLATATGGIRGLAQRWIGPYFRQSAGHDGLSAREAADLCLIPGRLAGLIGASIMKWPGAVRQEVGLTAATGDFAGVVVDGLNLAAQRIGEDIPSTARKWCAQRTVDRLEARVATLTAGGALPIKVEGATYGVAHFDDELQEVSLYTFGEIYELTREVLINDRTEQLGKLAARWSSAKAATDDALAYATLAGNPVMADGQPLFSTAHANTGTGALSTTTISRLRAAMAKQTDEQGRLLRLPLRYLIVPVERADDAAAAMADSSEQEETTMQLVASPELSMASTSQFYAAAPPTAAPTVTLFNMEGAAGGLEISQQERFSNDSRQFRVRYSVGVAVTDWRGIARSTGV